MTLSECRRIIRLNAIEQWGYRRLMRATAYADARRAAKVIMAAHHGFYD